MIGVIPRADQETVVEEFFELFKTPWEFYQPGRRYDVVIATSDEIPEADARLLLVGGPKTESADTGNGVSARSRGRGGWLHCQGVELPLYGESAAFEERGGHALASTEHGTAGFRFESPAGAARVRLGYDLFEETRILLSAGQPVEHAHVPTLDRHIRILRTLIQNEGIPLLEIPPAPAGHSFAVCLTHDIDFVGIRRHVFDHTMWGFLYRATAGSVRRALAGRIPVSRLLDAWRAALSLPFVYLGWAKDFWSPFAWYLEVEEKLPATYFLIPFKRRAGERVSARHASRRAAAYDAGDIPDWIATLRKEGNELGVHGIDAWHSVERGRAELARIADCGGGPVAGVRMHWLLNESDTASVLEEAGYAYDSTAGYNDTVGYRNGTAQVFRPPGAKELLELPMHIQDGALFYPQKLDLSEPEAFKRCQELIDAATESGGVLTLLWHDRSHAPERFWGEFYVNLLETLKSEAPWFGTAAQVTGWYRMRRAVRFERLGATGVRASLGCETADSLPQLTIRVHHPLGGRSDIPWKAGTSAEFDPSASGSDEPPAVRLQSNAVCS